MTGLTVGPADRVLVVAPHQDDEAIGCGGSLLKWAAAGATTGVLWISGTTGRERYGAEARAAAEVLGTVWTRALGLPPVGLVAIPETLDAVVRAVRVFAPSVVLLPHEDEDDCQHRCTAELALEATWIAAYPVRNDLGPPVARARAVLAYEVWTPIRRPGVLSDISAYAVGKEKAIGCYASQLDIADLASAALGLNRYRAVMSGVGTFAEAFAVLRLLDELP